jgi:hypothetical protein
MSLVDVLRAAAQTIASLVEGVGVAIVALAVLLAATQYEPLRRRSSSTGPSWLLVLGQSGGSQLSQHAPLRCR